MKLTGPQEAAAAFRNELLSQGWLTSAEVDHANDRQAANPALWAKAKRNAGELQGIWDPAKMAYVFVENSDRVIQLALKLAEFDPD